MAMNYQHNQYRQSQVTTASPGELTLMLYDGAIRFIKQTKQYVLEGNIEKANELNIRAQDIIHEFMITLNMDIEISHQLLPLYEYMKNRLIEANIKKDIDILDEVLNLITDLRQTWGEAIKIARQQQYPVGSLS